MPFGIGSAIEIYQKRQHEIVQGFSGVLIIADNFLVFGRGSNIREANGKAESAVKIVKQHIKKSVDGGVDFFKSLLQWRNTPNKLNFSPIERLYSRKTRCTIPMLPSLLNPRICVGVTSNIESQRSLAKKYYDRRTKVYRNIETGQKVMVKVVPNSDSWQQGVVKEKVQPASYIVSSNGADYRWSSVHVKPKSLAVDRSKC